MNCTISFPKANTGTFDKMFSGDLLVVKNEIYYQLFQRWFLSPWLLHLSFPDLESGAVCQIENSWALWALLSTPGHYWALLSAQSAQECSARHTATLSRSGKLRWRSYGDKNHLWNNWLYILFFTTSRSAEYILSNVPVLALGNDIVQFKTDL